MSTDMVRFTSAPTKFDTAPYGTFCTVYLNDEGTEYELYVQTAQTEEDPVWLSAHELLLITYKKRLVDRAFVLECLTAHETILT